MLRTRVSHVQHALASHPDVPLRVHARYSRLEILAAFGVREDHAKVAAWQTGVYWVPAARADLLAFTLDKTAPVFSGSALLRETHIQVAVRNPDCILGVFRPTL